MKIVGDKIILRPLINEDFIFFYKWHNDANIRFQTAMHPYPVSEPNEREWFDKAIADISNKRFIFTVVFKETGEPIGYFQLTEVNFINKNAMLGIVIGEDEYRGQGLGKEIMELGIDYGIKNLGLLKISLDVINENLNAVRLYKKLGFIEEGVFKNQFFFDGKFYNIVRLSFMHSNLEP